MTTALIVFAHGSTVESANDAVRAVTVEVALRGRYTISETAFLDCAPPSLPVAIESVVSRGAGRVLVVPYFLTLGIHLQRDMPLLIQEVKDRHPGLVVEVTEPLDGHAALVEIVLDRARSIFHGGSGSAGTTR